MREIERMHSTCLHAAIMLSPPPLPSPLARERSHLSTALAAFVLVVFDDRQRIHCGGLEPFVSHLRVETQRHSIVKVFKREIMHRMTMEVHLFAAVQRDEAVPFLPRLELVEQPLDLGEDRRQGSSDTR